LNYLSASQFDIGPCKTERRHRTIALPDITLRALKEHRKTTAILQGYVFQSTSGSFIDFSRVRKLFKRALKKAKLPDVRLYDTRHTAITHALAGGADLKFVSERAGHSTITLTADTYGHVMKETEAQVADIMGKILEGGISEAKEEAANGNK